MRITPAIAASAGTVAVLVLADAPAAYWVVWAVITALSVADATRAEA